MYVHCELYDILHCPAGRWFILRKNNLHVGTDMICKDRCLLALLIHRAFHNDKWTQRMPRKHSPDHNAPSSSLNPSSNCCRVFAFRCFMPYTPTSIYPTEHKTWFIWKSHLLPLSGHPVELLVCKFQPSSLMNSTQHRCINQTCVAEAHMQQRSLNRHWGDTVGCLLVHLGGQLLNGCSSICPNASPQLSFSSVIYDPWCTTFAMLLILDSAILPCMIYFYHGNTQTVYKISHFGNASTFGPKANDHAVLNVG